jgi:hypothetical protein
MREGLINERSNEPESSGNASDLYSGGARFKFRPEHRPSCLRFVLLFPVPLGKYGGTVSEIRAPVLHFAALQIIIRHRFYGSTRVT